jgi:bleomycin hydrolase
MNTHAIWSAYVKPFAILLLLSLLPSLLVVRAQDRRDRPVFEVKNDAMKDSIKAELTKAKPDEHPKKKMQLDFSAIKAPSGVSEFTSVWHFPPLLQGLSGMCWCFSTTSFLESEIYRLSKRRIKLSELHTVYWEYVEKAREFVRTRGTSHLGEGSEANAVFRIWKKYGVVPGQSYTGLNDGAKYHDHENTLFPEIKNYLESVKERDAWNEEQVIATVQSILDHYIGPPPATVSVDDTHMTPKEYLANVVRLNPDDYVDFCSLMENPYFQKVEFEVPDNWWHSKEYHNIPLDDFMRVLKNAIRHGYSVAIGGDFTEAGYSYGSAGIAVVPSFDIPASAIDEQSRQFRFSNGTTADDHGLHLVGFVEQEGRDWYLIKDSWSTAYNSAHPGYYFYHEDYVKLKMLGITVHKDAARDLLARFKD